MEMTKFIDDYMVWLRSNTQTFALDNGVIGINSPFVDRNNDCIQIFCIPQSDSTYVLSDDGYTINELEMSGMSFNTPKRKEELKKILNGFGIRLSNEEMCVSCTEKDFPIKKHNLIQAMLSVSDLFVLSQQNVSSMFVQDVEAFLRSHDVRFSRNIKVTGVSGFDHAYDFLIPPSEKMPERFVRAINNLDRNTTQSLLFAWSETRAARGQDIKLYTLINDKRNMNSSCLDALKEYSISPVPWSGKDEFIQELSA